VSRSEVLADGTIRGEKLLGVPSRLNPIHAPLSLANRFMGVFGMTVQVPVLVMFDTWGHLSLNGTVAIELVRDDHPWDIMAPSRSFRKNFAAPFPNGFVGHDDTKRK
jgi:hypothetical protein